LQRICGHLILLKAEPFQLVTAEVLLYQIQTDRHSFSPVVFDDMKLILKIK